MNMHPASLEGASMVVFPASLNFSFKCLSAFFSLPDDLSHNINFNIYAYERHVITGDGKRAKKMLKYSLRFFLRRFFLFMKRIERSQKRLKFNRDMRANDSKCVCM